MANTQYLSVFGFEPRLGWERQVGVQPEISVRFNQALDTSQVETDEALNTHVVLVRMDTDETFPVEYVSWNPTAKLLVFQPADELAAGAIYTVTLRDTFRGSSGRGLVKPVSWSFEVSAGQFTRPLLASPGDATAWSTLPTLEWVGASGSAVSGIVTYDVQVGDNWTFEDLAWTTTLSVSGAGGLRSVAIGSSLTGNATYFWRVRGRTAAASGDWSETRAFWVGSSAQASPNTEQLYQPDLIFQVELIEPEEGATNLAEWPTIRATFSQEVSGASVGLDSFQLWATSVDGRAEVAAVLVSGTYTVSADQVHFAPDGSIASNKRYTIRLLTTLRSTENELLPAVFESYFVGPYSPCYGGVIAVRAELGALVETVSDDEILFHLWRASLAVHEILYTQVYRVRIRATLAELISYQPPMGTTRGMLRFAEVSAAYTLLQTEYNSLLRKAGRRSALATFEREVKVELLAEIRHRLKELRDERGVIEATFFSKATTAQTGIKSQNWDPDTHRYGDFSFPSRRQF